MRIFIRMGICACRSILNVLCLKKNTNHIVKDMGTPTPFSSRGPIADTLLWTQHTMKASIESITVPWPVMYDFKMMQYILNKREKDDRKTFVNILNLGIKI